MNAFFRFSASALLVGLAVPLGAQQEVPMRGNTPVAPQGIKVPPLPTAPVRYETAEDQTIQVSVYARGFTNPWSMVFVSDDTILVAERGGAVEARSKRAAGIRDRQPNPQRSRAFRQGGIQELDAGPEYRAPGCRKVELRDRADPYCRNVSLRDFREHPDLRRSGSP